MKKLCFGELEERKGEHGIRYRGGPISIVYRPAGPCQCSILCYQQKQLYMLSFNLEELELAAC